MNALKKLAAVATLCLGLMASGMSFAQAPAAPAAPATPVDPRAGVFHPTHLEWTGATFNNSYGVWLPSISNLSAWGTSSSFQFGPINLPAATFDSVTLSGLDLFHKSDPNLIEELKPAASSFMLSGFSLASGFYILNVSGHATGGQAAYALQIDVTPVPEPETYALMLAGLGLLGLIARRRKNG